MNLTLMKPNAVFLALLLLFFVFISSAQQGINYKAIINDANGDALANTVVTVQFTILENGSTAIYQETHNPTTGVNGIVIVNIGRGTVINGDFNTINWGGSPYFLKTEIDIGEGLTDMGTTELRAVPYAFHAETANIAIIDEVVDADADPENELQTLTLVDNTLSLSDGGSIELPSTSSGSGQYYFADKDGDGFGYMYEPMWVLDGFDPPNFYVSNSEDCNDEDYYTQNGITEICDGIDNNCDGAIDEDWPQLGQVCIVGQGPCLRYGVYECNPDGGSPICSATPGDPSVEVCDGIDNDCNGQTDDGLVGPDAMNQNGVLSGVKQICDGSNGWVEPDYTTIENYEFREISCDGLDNDGDGEIDENITAPIAGLQLGVCYGALQVCDGVNGWAEPDYSNIANYESTEISCDGLDNDCDGFVDEDWPLLGQPCTVGAGQCLRYGVYECNPDGGSTICSAIPGVPSVEVCDGIDNDCNGVVDDGYQDGNGVYTNDVACGNCYTDCQVIYDVPNASGSCVPSGPTPICTMNCDPGYYNLDGINANGCEFYNDPSAVYVSSGAIGAIDSPGCGDVFSPCRSITYGIETAVNSGKTKVLVSSGLYQETVTVVNGISLHGGFDAISWTSNANNPNSDIYGVDFIGNHSVTIMAQGINQPTIISGFRIHGLMNNNSSGNSYGIYINNSTENLTLTNNEIYGGIGGRGEDGLSGIDGNNGNSGDTGGDAFDGYVVYGDATCFEQLGSRGGQLSVPEDLSGGYGGNILCPIEFCDGIPPDQNCSAGDGMIGSGTGGGAGGSGGFHVWVQNFSCEGYNISPLGTLDGSNGGSGMNGANGEGGLGGQNSSGLITVSHWYGQIGSAGSNGDNGSGGGGGGTAGSFTMHSSCESIYSTTLIYGATGGGGGSGAQGGTGGEGGHPGGASIGIFIVDGNEPVITQNIIYLGIGGNGGQGGIGGIKGIGGAEGTGGNSNDIVNIHGTLFSVMAGSGGPGGDGGNAGGGGGGTGGSCFGIFGTNMASMANYEINNQFIGGTIGNGGFGGLSLANQGASGVDGVAQNTSYQAP